MASSFPVPRFSALAISKQTETSDTINAPADAPLKVADEALLAQVCAGDREALACLFHRYARVVRGIAGRILRDGAEAEDLVQDLFLFIQRKCSIFDSSKSSAGSWIIQMTYQRAIERRRRLASRHFYKREDLRSSASQVVGMPTTEHDYSPETVFGRNGLRKVLGALSEDQRETLRLYFFEGYTLAEISVKLEQPLGNIRNHYYRALDKLRRQMLVRKVPGG
jgi:RNA polymerase sigma-70 factor, ECF subfamily